MARELEDEIMLNFNYTAYYSLKEDMEKVNELYIDAFPIEERCPLSILLKHTRNKRGEFLAIYHHNKFIGLIYNIVYKDIVYIYYLAIEEKFRHQGYGTKVLNDIKEMYKNKRIILMAETLDQKADNYQERVNRNNFYHKNGFVYQGYTVMEFGVVYDMLGYSKNVVSKQEFKQLIKHYFGLISYLFIYKRNTDIEK